MLPEKIIWSNCFPGVLYVFIEIWYYAWTSDPHATVWKEEITFAGTADGYKVTDSATRYLDSISSREEFREAYWIEGRYSFTDYAERGFVKAINYQTEYDRESGAESDRNAVYRSPETAVEWIFNLTGGEGTANIMSNGKATVEYVFADGSSELIPMTNANFNGETGNSYVDLSEGSTGTDNDGEESGENGDIWIVDLQVWDAGAP